MAKKKAVVKKIETLTHGDASRKNIPTAEFQSVMEKEQTDPMMVAYERRNKDLDPQLIWRGKDVKDWSDLVVHAPPLYIQEKVHPKVLIDDLRKMTADTEPDDDQMDLFGDFNGVPEGVEATEFYQHDQNWSNRMILGDSLQVMASLAEREGLRGKVQCIYFDPPYGIKFNSNFQWSTTSRDVKDGKTDHITREPEQVKAFRDTWRDGIHSYLSYLRDRLTVARDLLTDSGSIFVQIGDENVHRVRALMDEVFGEENFVAQIAYSTTTGRADQKISTENDYILFFSKNHERVKFRPVLTTKNPKEIKSYKYIVDRSRSFARPLGPARKGDILESDNEQLVQLSFAVSQDPGKPEERIFQLNGRNFDCGQGRHWKTKNPEGLTTLAHAGRLFPLASQLNYIRMFADNPCKPINNIWPDTGSAGYSSSDPKRYVVQTDSEVIKRCLLMTTDPGDLVLDPTCGSGTTATVAEQWGRRWITIDTSRVSLALARARIMGARYPYYLLADSPEGQKKEGAITQSVPSTQPTFGNIRHGFVYQRVPHIMLKSIANNTEIDVIYDDYQQKLEPLRKQLNQALGTDWEEWEIPRDLKVAQASRLCSVPEGKRDACTTLLEQWWSLRIARQKAIDASIAAKADSEYLYDKPYDDKKKVRVAGPFTVESLSPHRMLGVDDDDELIDRVAEAGVEYGETQDFATMILDNLRTAGVQQAHKEDKIEFMLLTGWPGHYICAEGRYTEGNKENGATKRAGVFIGPEFGTVTRPDLVAAAREAAEAGFDVLVACAFNYEARTTEFNSLGRIPVLKARINADLHMADDLKNTGKGNLFIIFGEPDIEFQALENGQIQIEIKGVDVFHPNTGEVRSDGPDGIACWFIDTDYNEESFFVRHAYFLGQNDPYKALKTTLKAEINEEAWSTLNSAISRSFAKPAGGRIAVKVINHLGDEVMKVFRV